MKTVTFKDPKYVGDPINAVKIFNEKEADELVVLDIDAAISGAEPDYRLIANIAAECRMPLCYGGGVRTSEQVKRIIGLGVEKVAMSSAAIEDPTLVTRAATAVGQQSVAVVLDVRKQSGVFATGYDVFTRNGQKAHNSDPFVLARTMQDAGAGEIVINSIDRDGRMEGYDLVLAGKMRRTLHIPLSVLGGAGKHDDLVSLFGECGLIGASAGSLFVFKGSFRAVLINYPNSVQRDEITSAGLTLHSKRTPTDVH